ncbi:M57 family metalloprotease [Rhodococcoides fascians]|uniref:M57 family metalloprotease n=1 Tax=Rhodococcoides fascians TaxID=1828 RepID=UPI0007AAC68D|nr:M57 family metalloprotease [Rhodococcus fascians]AMY56460.1 hypothetical protein A3L23_05162 [Rhodococcus fascians D188]
MKKPTFRRRLGRGTAATGRRGRSRLTVLALSVSVVASAVLSAPQAVADPRCANNDPFFGFCVGGRILQEFNEAGGLNFFGNATNTELPANRGGRWQPFTKSLSIYWHPNVSGGHANSIGGLIRDKWGQLGYENSPLLYPTTRELPTRKPGRFNNFEGGSIYWSNASGAHTVYGEIKNRWGALDWENGILGFPVSDEFNVKDGGKGQHFEGGSIYWSPGTGAHEVVGDIRQQWSAAGWENSPQGFPTSNPRATGCNQRAQTFQQGTLVSNFQQYTFSNLSKHSVDGARIAYTSNSQYSAELGRAIASWNAEGRVNIAPVGVFEINDVSITDTVSLPRPDESFSGRWTYNPGGTDTIQINYYFTQNYSSGQVQGVIAHELGHALSLDHSCAGQLMASDDGIRGTSYTPQALDKDIYHYRWK